jgi:hypothetical protein
MRPNRTIATGLIFALLAGPVGAQTQTPPPATGQQTESSQTASTPATSAISKETLARIREALGRESSFRIEDGQLRIYVEVVGHWPTFAEYSRGYDFVNGPTGGGFGKGNPLSHAEFVSMSTPRDLFSSAGIRPGEVLMMAAVGAVGQWALAKAIDKWSTSRREKELRDIRALIDAELAALAKANGAIKK